MSGTAFESRSMNVAALLGDDQIARVVVPTFQRGYSWEKRHVEAFWKDVTSFQNRSAAAGGPNKYFLGPIVILPKPQDGIIELLDGQQRLATAAILFSVLRDVARDLKIKEASDFAWDIQSRFVLKMNADGEDSGYFSLEMGEMDKLYFVETIQSDPPKKKKPTIRSHRNIKAARTFLEEAVRARVINLDPKSQLGVLKRLKLTLQRDLVMSSIPVDSERDAFSIFETLNDRGLRLSVPDLLLNYLMREAANEANRRKIRDFWNEMLERMGRRDISRFLRHLWVSRYGDLKDFDLYTALKDHIEKNQVDSMEFARTSSEECQSYVELLDVELEEANAQNAAPYVKSLVKELGFQPALPLLLSSYRTLTPADFERVTKWILVFIVRYSVIGNLDSSGLENVLFDLAREIRNQMGDPVKSKTCMNHIKNTLISNAPSDNDTELSSAKAILKPEHARYVLNRLANAMQSQTKEVAMGESNVEHIFPKNPADNQWGGKVGHEKLEPYLWQIGNLTILGKNINRNAGNSEFSVKLRNYAASEIAMTKRIKDKYTKWGKPEIESRGKELAKLAVKIWDFTQPSRV